MVEATQADTVVLPIAAEARPVVDMVVLEIAARGARRRGATPAIADEDRIGGEFVGMLRRIPRLHEVLEQGEKADPIRDAAGGDGKHPGGEARGGEPASGREAALRILFIPRDRLRFPGEAGSRSLHG